MYRVNVTCCWVLLNNQDEVSERVVSSATAEITPGELYTLAAETAACMTTKHPDYGALAARIAVTKLHKETKALFSGEYC